MSTAQSEKLSKFRSITLIICANTRGTTPVGRPSKRRLQSNVSLSTFYAWNASVSDLCRTIRGGNSRDKTRPRFCILVFVDNTVPSTTLRYVVFATANRSCRFVAISYGRPSSLCPAPDRSDP